MAVSSCSISYGCSCRSASGSAFRRSSRSVGQRCTHHKAEQGHRSETRNQDFGRKENNYCTQENFYYTRLNGLNFTIRMNGTNLSILFLQYLLARSPTALPAHPSFAILYTSSVATAYEAQALHTQTRSSCKSFSGTSL